MARRGITYATLEHDLQDIAGLRVMVQFVDDVKEVVEILHKRQDMRIIQERDYITHRKASGYRSYHVVVEYTVDTVNGAKTILAEIQIRTLAMNFWATIEHSLNYKYQGDFPEEINEATGNYCQNCPSIGVKKWVKFEMISRKPRLFLILE